MPEHQWYYIRNGLLGTDDEIGPISEAEIIQLAKSGKIKPETPVRCETRNPGKWFVLKQIPGLLQQLEAGERERALVKAEAKRQREEDEKAARTALAAQQAEHMNRAALISEEQNPDLIITIAERVQGILTSSESVQLIVVQERPLVNFSPDAVVITNRRLIFYRPKLLGRFEFEDYLLIDLSNAHLKQSFLTSIFSAQHTSGRKLMMDWLPKAAAQRLYRLAQELEERARQARIELDLQARRAGATNINIGQMPGVTPAISGPSTAGDPLQRLQTLKTMLDQGLITASDFENRKAEILKQI
jgi:hypothetical protein